jgi:ABC-type dipeptide/oligopeptide/nickel transport system ATPase subunit
MSIPDQYDTIVGERGLESSGGKKHRVAIARAILKNAPILLCDEPKSSLDGEIEYVIMSNLKESCRSSTTVIVAHRLSTIQDCNDELEMAVKWNVEHTTSWLPKVGDAVSCWQFRNYSRRLMSSRISPVFLALDYLMLSIYSHRGMDAKRVRPGMAVFVAFLLNACWNVTE